MQTRGFVLAVTIVLAAVNVAAHDVVINSQKHRFVTGDAVERMPRDTVVLYEDPSAVETAITSFNHDLSIDFWRDPQFHPAILQYDEYYKPCGRYPTRSCIRLNDYGGFITAPNAIPEEYIGYGVYERLSIEDGKLYPRGELRDRIVQQNLNKIQTTHTRS